jgi:hypothetical protein
MLGGDLTCIAWNPAVEDPFMFSTGSHDGAVHIWTTPPPPAFTIGVRAPSPAPSGYTGRPPSSPGGSFEITVRGPSPAPSFSPPGSGRTTPNPPAHAGYPHGHPWALPPPALYTPETSYSQVDSPVSATFPILNIPASGFGPGPGPGDDAMPRRVVFDTPPKEQPGR